MCLNPKKMYFEGKYIEGTYKGKKGENYSIETFVKCGHCSQCQAEKSNNWVIRNRYEKLGHKDACFITLTYAERYNTYFLVKKDLQDFIKLLRYYIDNYENKKIHVFTCGEYGTEHGRPHFHIIIYGWVAKDKKFWKINKRGNIVYKSEIIEKTWKKGITTYQDFDTHEIPYISLYETPKEDFRSKYTASVKSLKKLLKKLSDKNNPMGIYKGYRINMYLQLQDMIRQAEEQKKKYIAVKEFNTWSQALGWEEFKKEYEKHTNYNWVEYIEDKEFFTPTPWIKKLANAGDKNAIKEMLRRAAELATNETEEELATKNKLRKEKEHKNKILEYADSEKRDIF